MKGDIAMVPDLLDREAVRAAVRGMDGVVHLAAHVHDMAPTAESIREFQRINVDGTQLLLEEAKAANLRKFVFFSSVKAVGEANTAPWSEDVVPQPQDQYGESKLAAESLVLAIGLRATVLRLPLAYGPRMKGNMLRLFDAVARGIPLPFRNVQNKRSLVCSDNVGEAVRCSLQSDNAGGKVFFVSDGYDLSTTELIGEIGTALGKRPRLYTLNPSLLTAAGKIGDRLGRPGRPFLVNSDVLKRLFGSLTVDDSRLRRLTGYSPKVSPREGIRLTAKWYLDRESSSTVRSANN
jgi:nucleoside-diphosphate-sugar epimerase